MRYSASEKLEIIRLSNNPIYRFVARWRKSESRDPRSIDGAISIKPAGQRRWTIAVLGLIGCGTVSPMGTVRNSVCEAIMMEGKGASYGY